MKNKLLQRLKLSKLLVVILLVVVSGIIFWTVRSYHDEDTFNLSSPITNDHSLTISSGTFYFVRHSTRSTSSEFQYVHNPTPHGFDDSFDRLHQALGIRWGQGVAEELILGLPWWFLIAAVY